MSDEWQEGYDCGQEVAADIRIGLKAELAQTAEALKQASQALLDYAEREKELVDMIKSFSNLYTHAWDQSNGCLIMMPGSVELFEKIHERAIQLLEKHKEPK